MNSFLIALQFLTIIPVTHSYIASDKQLGYSTLFYPIIGLMIGSGLVLIAQLTSNIPIQIQAAIILTFWVMITGGLHLDGLADCADAWVGGLGSKQRSLEIMKDPAAGPIAVIVLVLVLLLKWSVISHLIEKQAFAALLFTPILGRLAILILMLITDYIRAGGMGEVLITNYPKQAGLAISLLGLFVGIFYLGFLSISMMLLTLITIKYLTYKRLGGATGDVYGATVELTEVSILLGVIL
jgi:adenosylcobinamide-GDP ribazoletransferase